MMNDVRLFQSDPGPGQGIQDPDAWQKISLELISRVFLTLFYTFPVIMLKDCGPRSGHINIWV